MNLIHRSDSNGRPRCGADGGRISTSGVCLNCEECKRLSAPADRSQQLQSLLDYVAARKAGGAR